MWTIIWQPSSISLTRFLIQALRKQAVCCLEPLVPSSATLWRRKLRLEWSELPAVLDSGLLITYAT